MPTLRKTEITSDNLEQLASVMGKAREYNDKIAQQFAGREEEIDEVENEIINNYTNNPDVRLSVIADHVQIQAVFANSQRMLSRVTEIYNGAIRNKSKLNAARQSLLDAILPLMVGGSADAREAKARDCTESINYLIALEEGLIAICESTQKNLRSAQEMASRQLKAIEIDIQHFTGAETLKNIVIASKKKVGLI